MPAKSKTIGNRKWCNFCKQMRDLGDFYTYSNGKVFAYCVECSYSYLAEYRKRKPLTQEYKMFHWAKSRARQQGIPFDIELSDIIIPEVCLVFGFKLRCTGLGRAMPDSPSLDRIKPELGYVKGNIRVISFKANSIKNDASIEELRQILQYMEDIL